MKKFRIVVSKDNKKYTLGLTAENELLAKQRVHSEGYSILTIEEYQESEEKKHRFIFEAQKDGKFQKGQIVGNDILKAYGKLRKSLGYEVIYIYAESDANVSLDKKESIMRQLREEYEVLNKNTKVSSKEKFRKEIEKNREQKRNIENFYMKKELEETYKLIDFILKKIEKIITSNNLELTIDQKEKLKILYNNIIKLKKSTNIAKLKEVGEKALLKIGKLELQKLEAEKNDYISDQLQETNKLLKNIGSKKHFIEKERDIIYKLSQLVSEFKNIFVNFKKENISKNTIDKKSHSYVKNQLFLKKYREKQKQHNIFILKNLKNFVIDKNKRQDLLLKKRVLQQNILLLKAKQKGVQFSYSSLKKGYHSFLGGLFDFLQYVQSILIFITLVFSVFFIVYLVVFSFYNIGNFHFSGMIFLLLSILLFFLLYYSRNLLFLVINFVIFVLFAIFFIVNF